MNLFLYTSAKVLICAGWSMISTETVLPGAMIPWMGITLNSLGAVVLILKAAF